MARTNTETDNFGFQSNLKSTGLNRDYKVSELSQTMLLDMDSNSLPLDFGSQINKNNVQNLSLMEFMKFSAASREGGVEFFKGSSHDFIQSILAEEEDYAGADDCTPKPIGRNSSGGREPRSKRGRDSVSQNRALNRPLLERIPEDEGFEEQRKRVADDEDEIYTVLNQEEEIPEEVRLPLIDGDKQSPAKAEEKEGSVVNTENCDLFTALEFQTVVGSRADDY